MTDPRADGATESVPTTPNGGDGSTRTVAATVAATAARRQKAAVRHAIETAERVRDLPKVELAALLLLLVGEVERRKRDGDDGDDGRGQVTP